ncbi:MAG: hypothetical protein WBO00_09425, partial [Steroidobacteraceae bacterium]
MLPALLALLEFVETDSEQTRDELQLRIGLAILAGSQVRRDGFRRPARKAAIRLEFVAQRRDETFLPPIIRPGSRVRLPIDDQREDVVASAHALEGAHFLVDPAGAGGRWRADDDEMSRRIERRRNRAAEISGAGQLFAVTEDWRESVRHGAVGRRAPDEALGNAVCF